MQYSSFTSSSSINNLRLLSTTQRIRHDRNVRDMNNNWCSNSSSSNSGPTRRGFGLPLSDTMSTTTTNNNPTTKKKNKKKKKNNKNEPNINTNPAPELSLTSQSGPSGFDSRNKVKAAITTSSSNDHEFNLKLQAIKRSAVRKKKLAQTTQYGAIDYDQPPAPPNSNNTDAPKTLGRGAMPCPYLDVFPRTWIYLITPLIMVCMDFGGLAFNNLRQLLQPPQKISQLLRELLLY